MKYLWLICLGLFLGTANLSAQSQLAGDWKTSFTDEEGQTWKLKLTMKTDQTYVVDFNADGSAEIEGTYSTKGNEVTIQDVKGSECKGKGVYKFTIEGDGLLMEAIEDACPGRKGPDGKMSFTRA
ncbi:MAG: hypothetical protein KI786_09015 [Mameliella sp.]|nr:hypothetical protein [Phaeodactylibacter sp.]NRA51086.1 hypothetical protein [Phaeodactylibacter sp.]